MSFTIRDKKTGKSVTFTKKPWTPLMERRGKVGAPKLAKAEALSAKLT